MPSLLGSIQNWIDFFTRVPKEIVTFKLGVSLTHFCSTNVALPEPPEEFINLSTPNYCAQRYTVHDEPVASTANIKTDNGVTPAVTERKLVPILKATPTLPRSNYSSEGNGNNN